MVEPIRIGIDASNLRNGGGVTHLRQLIGVSDPARNSFGKITIWGEKKTLEALPQDRGWLDLRSHNWLNQGSAKRVLWRRSCLPRELDQTSDLLFAPGGLLVDTSLPSVTMCRNMMPFETKERQRATGLQRIRFELLKRWQTSSFLSADGVIFLTDYARNEVVSQMPRPPKFCEVIAHGLAPRFAQPPKAQKPITNYSVRTPFRLLYVSSVNVYKHQWTVVEACAQLRKRGYPVRLDLAGGGSDARSVARLRAAMDTHDPEGAFVDWLGNVPFEQMHELYRQADAFIFASSCENLPNILLEAMSASLPILSTRSGPMPSVLGPKGFYFDIDSDGALGIELEHMLESPEARAQAAHSASERAKAYSWEKCADATFAALRQVALTKNGASITGRH